MSSEYEEDRKFAAALLETVRNASVETCLPAELLRDHATYLIYTDQAPAYAEVLYQRLARMPAGKKHKSQRENLLVLFQEVAGSLEEQRQYEALRGLSAGMDLYPKLESIEDERKTRVSDEYKEARHYVRDMIRSAPVTPVSSSRKKAAHVPQS